MCDVAAQLVDELAVLVCTRDCEPIDGRLRAKWMRESVRPNVRIIHLHRDIPQEPGEHPDFWAIWKNTIRELHPEAIDMVFGSEDYVHRLAAELGADPFIVDRERSSVNISSTQIRENPRGCWSYIPAAVRHYYQQRICLLGPESTGKSELSRALAAKYQTSHVPEYGRTYDATFRQGKGWQASDFIAIAKGHRALQQRIARHAGYTYFEDTDLLQTLVWSEYLLGYVADELMCLLADWNFANLYLLLEPDIAWVDDGTRYSGDAEVRNWFFERLKFLLTDLDLPFHTVSGEDWHTREISARSLIDAHLQNIRPK